MHLSVLLKKRAADDFWVSFKGKTEKGTGGSRGSGFLSDLRINPKNPTVSAASTPLQSQAGAKSVHLPLTAIEGRASNSFENPSHNSPGLENGLALRPNPGEGMTGHVHP